MRLCLEVSNLSGAKSSAASAGRASLERDALDVGAKTTVLVVGDAHGVLLGAAEGLLGGSLSLGVVDLLDHGDLTVDVECPVLGLNSEGRVGSSCALAAVGLADLAVLSVRYLLEVLCLDGLDPLLKALSLASAEARKLRECAWAREVAEREGGLGHVRDLAAVVELLGLSLDQSVVQAALEAFGGNDSDAEGNEEDASHSDFAVVVIYISGQPAHFYTHRVTIFGNFPTVRIIVASFIR